MKENLPKSALQIGVIRNDLDNMYHFSNLIEKSLKQELDEVGKYINEHGESPSISDELWNLTEVLPYLFRGSALLSILGFYEHNLNAVCDSLKEEFNKDVRITDLNGKGLRRSKLYMSKEIGITFPANTEAWNYLLKLSDIRNLISHRDSLVKDDNPELLRFIENTPYLSVDFTNRVRLHEGALNSLLDYLDMFFKELSEAICDFSSKGNSCP